VQGYGQFHHAQTTGKMAWVAAQFVYQKLAQLIADLRQLLYGQFSQVRGVFYGRKQTFSIVVHNILNLFQSKDIKKY
jgi:hypothetical protein